MKIQKIILHLIISLSLLSSFISAQDNNDPYLWLEEVDGKKALEWVNTHNKATIEDLKNHPEFSELKKNISEILNSDERIPYPTIYGEYIYNFWKDKNNERGLWRRTSLNEYFKDLPKWETVLDIDSLCEAEGENWTYSSAIFLQPEFDLCMLNLSRGGSDAVVMREFDLKQKSFVKDGFHVPQAKGYVNWIDKNTLIISTDFGEGTITSSGYPRMTKFWKRGTSLSEAQTIYEGEKNDVGIWGYVQNTSERQYIIVQRGISTFTSRVYTMENDELVQLEIPDDSRLTGFFKNQMLVELKSEWNIGENTYDQGVLIGIDYDSFLKGDRNFDVIFQPEERSSLESVSTSKNFLLLNKLTNVVNELYRISFEDGEWKYEKVNALDFGTITIRTVDDFSDQFIFYFENFLIPRTLYYVSSESNEPQKLKSLPEYFDGSKFSVKQHEAVSKDGMKIPYFLVYSKEAVWDGSNPTLLYGYGGFEVSRRPFYSSLIGTSWLERGGVFVLANIRGGGEFGPEWHKSAMKENKQLSYNDFIAISEDLINRKITSPEHLGVMGGSNGGLLVGVVFTQRPDLYNAVVCSVPLLDMKRYNKLLAGSSWMGEFGDPDIAEEWEYIKKYSPYHNLFESKKYPEVLFTTTTRDDRVHPGHARKMAAKMKDQGHGFYYFENTEGGHGSGVTNEQKALMYSIEYTYLLKMLK
jgi:prolyl oligopeptidase